MTPSSDLHQPVEPVPEAEPIDRLVARLDGIERQPLTAQVVVLDAVRRGLDDALARPAVVPPTAAGPAIAPEPTRHRPGGHS